MQWLGERRAGGTLYSTLLATTRPSPGRSAIPTQAAATHRRRRPRAPSRVRSARQRAVRAGRSDRGRRADGYQPIDWYLDPMPDLRFPERVPHREWNLLEMRPGLADIKLPWELGRCQHWVPLGQAFRLTGDERYAVEIVRSARRLHGGQSGRHRRATGRARWMSRSARFNWALASGADSSAARSTRTRSWHERVCARCSITASSSRATSRTSTRSPAITSSATSSAFIGLALRVPRSAAWRALDRAVPRVARAGNARPGAAGRRRLRIVRAVPPPRGRAVPVRRGGSRSSRASRCRTGTGTRLRTMIDFLRRCCGPTAACRRSATPTMAGCTSSRTTARWQPQDARHLARAGRGRCSASRRGSAQPTSRGHAGKRRGGVSNRRDHAGTPCGRSGHASSRCRARRVARAARLPARHQRHRRHQWLRQPQAQRSARRSNTTIAAGRSSSIRAATSTPRIPTRATCFAATRVAQHPRASTAKSRTNSSPSGCSGCSRKPQPEHRGVCRRRRRDRAIAAGTTATARLPEPVVHERTFRARTRERRAADVAID